MFKMETNMNVRSVSYRLGGALSGLPYTMDLEHMQQVLG